MHFEQFYLTCLAHASYLFGSQGQAAVVDPQRDVDIYLEAAAQHGLRITHIFETHLHADFVSGHRELARRTGAQIYVGGEAHALFPHVPLSDNMEITVGMDHCLNRRIAERRHRDHGQHVQQGAGVEEQGEQQGADKIHQISSHTLSRRSTRRSNSRACSTIRCTRN